MFSRTRGPQAVTGLNMMLKCVKTSAPIGSQNTTSLLLELLMMYFVAPMAQLRVLRVHVYLRRTEALRNVQQYLLDDIEILSKVMM
eukprot:6190358-Pleurochrysis_carterae.AAC.1